MPDGSRRVLEFEVRHWMSNTEANIGLPGFGEGTANLSETAGHAPMKQPKAMCGNLVYGSKGYMALTGYESYRTFLGENNEPGPSATRGGNTFANFIRCVRSRNKADIPAPIEEGHITATLIHLANTSYRLGRTLKFDAMNQRVIGDEEASRYLRGEDRGFRAPYTIPEKV
jgi:hypothetical protein